MESFNFRIKIKVKEWFSEYKNYWKGIIFLLEMFYWEYITPDNYLVKN